MTTIIMHKSNRKLSILSAEQCMATLCHQPNHLHNSPTCLEINYSEDITKLSQGRIY